MNWELILNYINQQADAHESRQVESWLAAQPQNRQLLAYLQKRQAQLQQPLKQTDIDEQWLRLLNRVFKADAPGSGPAGSWRFYQLIGMAASLLLISLSGWFYFRSAHHQSRVQTFALQTPAARRGQVTLPDGTQVFMAPASRLTYTSAFGVLKREVSLTGEAFFKVKHQLKHPFIIHTPARVAIAVLGTSFNVFARQQQNTEVKVASGRVGVTAHNHTCFLQAGEQLSYRPSAMHFTVQAVDLHEATALATETLVFKNSSATEIAARLQRWYNIHVTALPSAREHAHFSGEMKDDGLGNVLRGLSYATGIHYRFKNSTTLLLF